MDLFHTVCDEPQAGIGSVPFVPKVTNKKVLVRLHGRNVFGWRNSGAPNWREVRFLYVLYKRGARRFSKQNKRFESKAEEVFVLFNNNSGHHAASNAKMFQEILNINFKVLHLSN